MKNTLLKLALTLAVICTLGFGSAYAQTHKFGYIDFQELMQLMPEYKKANTEMEAFNKTLSDHLQGMTAEFEKKYGEYNQQEAKMPEALKEMKQKELRDLQSRIQENQESAQEKSRTKEQELLKPIVEKAKATIAQVAKEGGYVYIFDSSPGSPLLYKPDGDNILPAVKKKLGIL